MMTAVRALISSLEKLTLETTSKSFGSKTYVGLARVNGYRQKREIKKSQRSGKFSKVPHSETGRWNANQPYLYQERNELLNQHCYLKNFYKPLYNCNSHFSKLLTSYSCCTSQIRSVFTPRESSRNLEVTRENKINFLRVHLKGIKKKKKKKNPLGDKPFAKGVVLKTLVKKPKKPNSANRKCVLLRLSTGKEMTAYVPGEGHNLQEHNIVLVRVGRLRDVPGVKLKCVRGKYDLGHVVKKKKV